MLQAPIFYMFSFDPFTLLDDGLYSAKICIRRHDVFQALVIALVVVVFDERFALSFEVSLVSGASF